MTDDDAKQPRPAKNWWRAVRTARSCALVCLIARRANMLAPQRNKRMSPANGGRTLVNLAVAGTFAKSNNAPRCGRRLRIRRLRRLPCAYLFRTAPPCQHSLFSVLHFYLAINGTAWLHTRSLSDNFAGARGGGRISGWLSCAAEAALVPCHVWHYAEHAPGWAGRLDDWFCAGVLAGLLLLRRRLFSVSASFPGAERSAPPHRLRQRLFSALIIF